MKILSMLAVPLLLTWIIEGIVVIIFTRKPKFVLYSIWCNIITNPLLNFIGILLYDNFGIIIYWCWAFVGEILVLFSEMWLYGYFDSHSLSKKYYFFLSLTANGISVLLGFLILR